MNLDGFLTGLANAAPWAFILEALTSLFVVLGGVFVLVGAIGLVRLGDPFSRLHAPTKASTLGVGSILAASMLYSIMVGAPAIKAALIMGFIFITSPVAAHFIAKANIHHRRDIEELPSPETDPEWAVLSREDTSAAPDLDPAEESPETSRDTAAGG